MFVMLKRKILTAETCFNSHDGAGESNEKKKNYLIFT